MFVQTTSQNFSLNLHLFLSWLNRALRIQTMFMNLLTAIEFTENCLSHMHVLKSKAIFFHEDKHHVFL